MTSSPTFMVLTPEDFDSHAERIARRVASLLLASPAPKDETPAGLLTAKEVRARLQVSASTLWEMRRRGKLAPVYIGRAVRFRSADVDALCAPPSAPC